MAAKSVSVKSPRLQTIFTFLSLLILAGCAATSAQSLVGTWRVVRFCDVDSLERPLYPLGEHPRGMFVYTPNGQLSLHAMRAPGDSTGRDLQPVGRLDGYFGYFGTYTITSDTTVVHHVTGGTIPEYIGTEQPRRYRIWGPQRDSLTIGGNRAALGCRLLTRIN